MKLINAQESTSNPALELEEYDPGPPGIKMSIGRVRSGYLLDPTLTNFLLRTERPAISETWSDRN